MKIRTGYYHLGLLIVLLTVSACSQPGVENTPQGAATAGLPAATETAVPEEISPAPTTNLTEGCVEDYIEGLDYFPEKTLIDEATGITIDYFPNYKVVEVTNPWPEAETTFQYVLVQCGTPAPEGFDEALVVEVPVMRFVSMVSAQLSHLDELDEVNSLVGLESFDFASNAAIRAKIEAGELVDIGSGAEVNVEAAINLDPDLVMTFGSGFPEFDSHPALMEAGIPTALNSSYREETPLGRAEWIKFTAVFFNKETRANELFAAQVTSYQALAEITAGVSDRPTAFLNVPRGESWSMPGGRSYQAQFLADAGAAYLWGDEDSSGNLSLDFETVFETASEADFWINPSQRPILAEGQATDERFTEFAAFQNGNIYDNNANLNEFGGNLYWELGVTHPDRILADLIKIFHPDLLPDHALVFFQQLVPAEG